MKNKILLTAMISLFTIRGMAQTVYEIPPAVESINACDLDLDGDMDIIFFIQIIVLLN